MTSATHTHIHVSNPRLKSHKHNIYRHNLDAYTYIQIIMKRICVASGGKPSTCGSAGKVQIHTYISICPYVCMYVCMLIFKYIRICEWVRWFHVPASEPPLVAVAPHVPADQYIYTCMHTYTHMRLCMYNQHLSAAI